MATRPEPLPFNEAIQFLRQKVNLPTERWTDLWQGMHARAFVVAGAMRDELISDLRAAVDKSLSQGTTLAEFRKDFDRIVAQHGWSYKGGRGWRTGVILNTNLRTAYQAGRWQQIQEVKARRPYLRYTAILDDRTRPEHAAWHGTVLPADDPWWQTHYPPNGWNCRCTVQQLSESDLDRFGYSRTGEAPPVDMVQRTINTAEGPVTIEVPDGIDPGFAYNVGEAAWGRGQQLSLLEKHGEWEALEGPARSRPLEPIAPTIPTAELGSRVRPGDEVGLRDALRRAIKGDEATFADPKGGRVKVTQALVDHMLADPKRQDGREAFFPFIPELVENPAEIWVGFAKSRVTGRVALRRRYVNVVDVGRGQAVGLVADAEQGFWSGLTFFRGRLGALDGLRLGLRVHRQR